MFPLWALSPVCCYCLSVYWMLSSILHRLFSSPCQRLEMRCCMKQFVIWADSHWLLPQISSALTEKNFKTILFLATERIQATPCGCYPGIYWVENSLTNYRNGQTQSVNQKTMYITIYICFPVEKMNRNINFMASSVKGKNDCFYELCMNHKNQNKNRHLLHSLADFSTFW